LKFGNEVPGVSLGPRPGGEGRGLFGLESRPLSTSDVAIRVNFYG